MEGEKGAVCVTGAAGYIGSWLVKRLLEQGYTVRATVRDPSNVKKVKHLTELPEAGERLSLHKADLVDEGSFDAAIDGCVGVFHVASPMDLQVQDPENEMIKPTVEGLLNVLRSCTKARTTLRRVVYTSTAGTVAISPQRKSSLNEDDWTDVEFCRAVKMTAWMYFVGKTVAERTAFEFAAENGIDLVSVIPTVVVGPFLIPTMPPTMLTALALLTRNEPFYPIINPGQYVHMDDLCMAHIFLFETAGAKGRFICSSHDLTIADLAAVLRRLFPQYDVPADFEGVGGVQEVIEFSSRKLKELGFQFKHSLEDMYLGTMETLKEKGLLPPLPNKP